MKVIDLLNKIANGNIPKRIIYDEYVYIWNNKIENYEREIDIDTTLNWDYIAINCLNEPVEIIEENKKIEKIPYYFSLNYIDCNINDTAKEEINKTINDIYDKINEIIDYLESKGE